MTRNDGARGDARKARAERLDKDAWLARLTELETEAARRPAASQDTANCCCHGFDESCGHGFEDRHVHKCLPRALDLGGHCPDSGCEGNCWRATPPGDPT